MKKIVSVLSALAWVAIEIMVILNPSGTLLVNGSGLWFCTFFLITPLAAFFFPFAVFKIKERKKFFFFFTGGFIFLLSMAIYGGSSFHRDFYVYTTQIVLLYLIIFLLQFNVFCLVRRKKEVCYALFIGAIVVFVLWTFWLMMMSFAIVTRTEPRWIESIAYNLINGIIGLILLFTAVLIREGAKRTISLKHDNLYLDDRNISEMLSPQENHMVYLFLLAPNHILNCQKLVEHLQKRWPEESHETIECERCIKEKWTVSSCPAYRNLKNRISVVKRYLELLQIGTIVPVSENPREIKEEGWCLRLFDDVRWDIAEHSRRFKLISQSMICTWFCL